jgi:hypothetical protein
MWLVIFKVEFEISGPNTFALNNIYLVLEVLAGIFIYSVTSGYIVKFIIYLGEEDR